MSKQDLNAIIEQAFDAAREASADHFRKYGDRDCCGFAWVNIKPGTSAIARELKKRGDARKSYYGGVDVWDPGKTMSQNMGAKEAGAQAFAKVLQDAGYKAYMMSRMD